MNGLDDLTDVLVVTDDELVALSDGTDGAFWGRIPTVQVSDPTERATAVERGLRSLAVRGLLTEDGLPHSVLGPLLSCVGLAPWALASPIDDEARLRPDAALLLMFEVHDRQVAWRSDPVGTHVVAPITRDKALEILADQLDADVPGAAARTAVTLANAAGRGVGGFIRTADGVVRVDNVGAVCGEMVDRVGPAELAEAQATTVDTDT